MIEARNITNPSTKARKKLHCIHPRKCPPLVPIITIPPKSTTRIYPVMLQPRSMARIVWIRRLNYPCLPPARFKSWFHPTILLFSFFLLTLGSLFFFTDTKRVRAPALGPPLSQMLRVTQSNHHTRSNNYFLFRKNYHCLSKKIVLEQKKYSSNKMQVCQFVRPILDPKYRIWRCESGSLKKKIERERELMTIDGHHSFQLLLCTTWLRTSLPDVNLG